MAYFVGTVKELWRYPVKSMAGEQVEKANIEKGGLYGDRLWALRDEKAGELTSVRKMPKQLLCTPSYDHEPQGKIIPHITIELPDGTKLHSSDDNANEIISHYLNKELTLWPLQAKRNWQHYRLTEMSGAKAIKKQFASKTLPDMSSISWLKMLELAIFSTPLGRYYDCYPLHLITTNTFDKLQELEPDGDFNSVRFRPNIVIDSATKQAIFEEFDWLDGHLRIGDLVIKCVSKTLRCSMPAQPQVNFGKDAKILRTLEKHTGRHLGINASVIKVGQIKVGDRVEWLPARKSALRNKLRLYSGRIRSKLIHNSMNAIDRINESKVAK
tara:strand:+ start:50375 stop:51355 length:981 start_codon:yes stop_codon:yes gene_type:complete